MKRRYLPLLALLVPATNVVAETTLSGLSIVDVVTGTIAENQTLVIDDGVIRFAGSDSERAASDGGGLRYDFAGKYAIPGLWDMHVHLRGGLPMAEDNRLWLRQYLGHGVTAVRDAGGDIPEFVVAWREAIANGSMTGPHIYTALRKVDGSPVFRPGSVEIREIAQVAPAIRSLQLIGADFIKVNDGEFPGEVFLEVIRQAHSAGLATAAHIPLDVSLEDLVEAGLDSIEHDFHLVRFGSARERQVIDRYVDAEVAGDFFMHFIGMYNDLALEIDDDKARHGFRLMAEHGVAITPTLYLGRRWHAVDETTDPERDPGYFETPESMLRSHDPHGMIEYMGTRSAERIAAELNMIFQAKRLAAVAAQEGVTILAGSDTGWGNTFMYPGDSLHHELRELVEAGLAPSEALAAATVNAARWLGVADEAGSLDVGMRADIVVLEANPLEDIRNSRSIVAVFQGGRMYDHEALADLRRLPR